MIRIHVIGLLLVSFPSLLLADWRQYQQDIMGTRVSVELYADQASKGQHCANRVFDEMHRIDALMSPYKPHSELARINREADQGAIDISAEMHRLLQQSLAYSELSAGAFDISFASVGFEYDYRQRKQPSGQNLQQLLDRIGYRQIELSPGRIAFKKPGMKIDLGGIAKGYAVDRAIALLESCGIGQALVSAGGDSRILGDRNGRDWLIGIQHPRNKREVVLRIPLSNTAISTSGDYQRFYIQGDERIHHIIDPRTGLSADQSWSATVIGKNAMMTDALSTTVFILGARRGLELINSLDDVDAIIIDANAVIHYSSGLKNPYLTDNNNQTVSGKTNGNPE